MKVVAIAVAVFACSAWAQNAPRSSRPGEARVLYDDVTDQHIPMQVVLPEGSGSSTGNADNRSGLGDGTNPGQGSGTSNSPNEGTDNPNNSGGGRR